MAYSKYKVEIRNFSIRIKKCILVKINLKTFQGEMNLYRSGNKAFKKKSC